MARSLTVSAALVYAAFASTVAAVPSWVDGFFDAPPAGGSATDRRASPSEDLRDHELGRLKRSSDDLYFESPISSHNFMFSSSCDDYELWLKSVMTALAAVACLAAFAYLVCCCHRCHSANKEHGYCSMKCHGGHCGFSSSEP